MAHSRDSRQTLLRELCTLGDWIRYAASRFEQADLCFGHGFERALDEASFLVLTSLHLPHDLPPAYVQAKVLPTERKRLLQRIERRAGKREPLAYIVGEAWFAGLAFKSTPAALIPRSPIAELIETGFQPWLGARDPQRILDLCTGGGCIAIACASRYPEAEVVGVDLSEPALDLARENALLHGVSERVQWQLGDLFEGLSGHFDLIISNPPYVGQDEMNTLPAEFRHEPAMGLVSGSDGLDTPLAILARAPDFLTPHGLFVLEVGASDDALRAVLPDLPGHWVEFERGGSGVIVIEASELRAFGPVLSRLIRERSEEL